MGLIAMAMARLARPIDDGNGNEAGPVTIRISKRLLVFAVLLLAGAGLGVGGYLLGRSDGEPAPASGTTSARPRSAEEIIRDIENSPDVRAWRSRRGEVWELFKASFKAGYFDACRDLFGRSSDGLLYADGEPVGIETCNEAFPDEIETTYVPDLPPEQPDAIGRYAGGEEACYGLLGLASNGRIVYDVATGKFFGVQYCTNEYTPPVNVL